jgi:hypothetical protein
LNNNTAGVRERNDANRTREAGHLDEIQGVVANTLKLHRQGAVGFIDRLDVGVASVSPDKARGTERYGRDYSADRAGSETELLKCLNRGTIQQRVSSAPLNLNGLHLPGGHVHIDHE